MWVSALGGNYHLLLPRNNDLSCHKMQQKLRWKLKAYRIKKKRKKKKKKKKKKKINKKIERKITIWILQVRNKGNWNMKRPGCGWDGETHYVMSTSIKEIWNAKQVGRKKKKRERKGGKKGEGREKYFYLEISDLTVALLTPSIVTKLDIPLTRKTINQVRMLLQDSIENILKIQR